MAEGGGTSPGDATSGVPTPVLISDDDSFESLARQLVDEPVLAIDTEFHRERTYFAQLALVQIAWPDGVALIDPLSVRLEPLAELLTGDRVIVMHAARQDLEVLERACGRVPEHLVDTQIAAGLLGYTSPSLSTLLERELAVTLPKADRLTDWLQRPLTGAQLRYAASDVVHLIPVWELLGARLRQRNRQSWLEEAMAELLAEPRGARDPDQAWRRIKEIRHLRGHDLAVAKAVAAWRERLAIHQDVTPRFVLSDLGVVGVSVGRPSTVEELRRIRGVDGRTLRTQTATELLAVIREADRRPRPVSAAPVHAELDADLRPAVPLVSAWVNQLARDLEIEVALLATRSDLEALLRGDPDARLAHGWRAELVGEPIRRLLAGDVALAFDRRRGLHLVDGQKWSEPGSGR